jgi:hypothetical protein
MSTSGELGGRRHQLRSCHDVHEADVIRLQTEGSAGLTAEPQPAGAATRNYYTELLRAGRWPSSEPRALGAGRPPAVGRMGPPVIDRIAGSCPVVGSQWTHARRPAGPTP